MTISGRYSLKRSYCPREWTPFIRGHGHNVPPAVQYPHWLTFSQSILPAERGQRHPIRIWSVVGVVPSGDLPSPSQQGLRELSGDGFLRQVVGEDVKLNRLHAVRVVRPDDRLVA